MGGLFVCVCWLVSGWCVCIYGITIVLWCFDLCLVGCVVCCVDWLFVFWGGFWFGWCFGFGVLGLCIELFILSLVVGCWWMLVFGWFLGGF